MTKSRVITERLHDRCSLSLNASRAYLNDQVLFIADVIQNDGNLNSHMLYIKHI